MSLAREIVLGFSSLLVYHFLQHAYHFSIHKYTTVLNGINCGSLFVLVILVLKWRVVYLVWLAGILFSLYRKIIPSCLLFCAQLQASGCRQRDCKRGKCCVFWPAFGCCADAKAGRTTYKLLLPPYLLAGGLSPLPGFEPRTSLVVSRRANQWAMTTW